MSTERPFLTAGDTSEALAAAMALDHEVMEIANGKRKPGRLSLEKLAIVLSFVRERSQAPASQAPSSTQAEPVAWIRYCSDGGYEGPLLDVQMEEVRKRSGAWTPLYAATPAAAPAPEVTAQQLYEALDANFSDDPVRFSWRRRDKQTKDIWRGNALVLNAWNAHASGTNGTGSGEEPA